MMKQRSMRSHPLKSMVLGALVSGWATGHAEQLGREQIVAWINQPAPVVMPDAGSVLGEAEVETIRALLPPGYSNEFEFPGVALEIQATATIVPHPYYQAASAKFAGQATLGADGTLQNFTAGQPFANERLDAVPAGEAGLMVAWNRSHRWQYYGWKTAEIVMNYLRPTKDGVPGTLKEGFEGGGNVDRWVVQNYHRVYLNHLAMLPDQGYRVNASDSDKRLYKDYVEFFEPFDVQGTKFVIERPLDATEEDQVNSYLPTQRRVRRLSAQERADSFMGSDMTMDDFEGFSGRVLDYEWTYLGKKDVLHVADAKLPTPYFFGPNSRVPNDRWQVRPCLVVEIKSKWAQHPYASKIMFIDAETYNIAVALAFNRQGEVWKIFSPLYVMPTPAAGEPAALESSVPRWATTIAIDRIANTATVARAATPTETPTMTDEEIDREFNVSNLTEGR